MYLHIVVYTCILTLFLWCFWKLLKTFNALISYLGYNKDCFFFVFFLCLYNSFLLNFYPTFHTITSSVMSFFYCLRQNQGLFSMYMKCFKCLFVFWIQSKFAWAHFEMLFADSVIFNGKILFADYCNFNIRFLLLLHFLTFSWWNCTSKFIATWFYAFDFFFLLYY